MTAIKREVDEKKVRNLQWRSFWMHEDWQELGTMSLSSARDKLMGHMPYTEDGVKVRDKNSGEEWSFTPPREQMHFGP